MGLIYQNIPLTYYRCLPAVILLSCSLMIPSLYGSTEIIHKSGIPRRHPVCLIGKNIVSLSYDKIWFMQQTKDREFDTVKAFRKIKEKIAEDLYGKSTEQIKDYLRTNSLKFQS
jgi:hypothetical protein